jgi:mxaL protein
VRLPGDVAGSLRQWRFWLLPLAFALLLLAIANPVVQLDRPRFDYLFVLDITQSMNVVDVTLDGESASRLALAREAVRHTMRRLPCGSKAGLGMFTEHRTLMLFAPVEVCENVGAFDNTLATLDWRVAWVSRSEVAKAVYSGMRSVEQMGENIRLVFITDGHEAPPVPPEFNVPLEQYAGKVGGVIAGVGGPVPVPIPVLSDEGELLGYWRAEDVQQVDNYTLGRRGDVENEGADVTEMRRLIAAGTEHLSSLRENYLRTLAARAGLDYLTVDSPGALARTLRRTRYSEPFTVEVTMGAPLGGLTLAVLLLYLLLPMVSDLRRASPA